MCVPGGLVVGCWPQGCMPEDYLQQQRVQGCQYYDTGNKGRQKHVPDGVFVSKAAYLISITVEGYGLTFFTVGYYYTLSATVEHRVTF